MDAFMQAAALVFAPASLLYMLVGTFFGILCGAMPGLSAVMAVSILLPFSFSLDEAGIMMLLGTFCGAIYGGSITAILINTPGTANSAATCLDGYPMATVLGQPGRALDRPGFRLFHHRMPVGKHQPEAAQGARQHISDRNPRRRHACRNTADAQNQHDAKSRHCPDRTPFYSGHSRFISPLFHFLLFLPAGTFPAPGQTVFFPARKNRPHSTVQ